MTYTHSPGSLSDDDLLRHFGELVRRDHQHTAQLLRHIDEIDRRQLWAKHGHPSMFDFCVVRFHMSESVAGKRIGAARAARRFPLLFDMVARGEIHLSGIHCLKAHLSEDNHREVLAEAKHKTIKEIERLVARLAPQPDVPPRVRALPRRPAASPPPSPELALGAPSAGPDAAREPALGEREPPPPPRSPDPRPLAPRRYKLEVTIDEETHGELSQLQDLLAHQIPNGDPAAIVKRALSVLLEHTLKKKAASTPRPRAARETSQDETSPRSRSIPAHVRREVWERDQARCAFVGEDGRRCSETRCLEYAHAHPWGKGGEHTATNVALRCRAHNAYEANRDYGEAFMASKRREPSRVREPVAHYGQSRPSAALFQRRRTLGPRGTSHVASTFRRVGRMNAPRSYRSTYKDITGASKTDCIHSTNPGVSSRS